MAEFGKITLPGVDDLIKDFDKFDKAIQDEIEGEMKASADIIVRNQKRAVQNQSGTDQGILVRLISQRRVAKMTRELISGAEYSSFREFGTKSRKSIPSGLEAIAESFKGVKLSAGGLSFRQAIYEWARRKGLPKESWWLIYNSIRKHGSYAKPFFFAPYLHEIPLLRKRIENIINKTEP